MELEDTPTIYVVDDDVAVLKALNRLLRSHGFRVETFSSGEEFFASVPPNVAGCLILDVKMPMMNGLELQERLAAAGSKLPIIFMTAFDDPAGRDRALKAGAVAFLAKPLNDDILVAAIREALSRL